MTRLPGTPRRSPLSILWLPLALSSPACGIPEPPGELLRSNVARDASPDVTPAERESFARDRNEFALALYRAAAAAGSGNLFFSPHSVSLAFAMTWAGARGDTATEMASVLRYGLGERTHDCFNDLDLQLGGAAANDDFELRILNQLFGQTGFAFLPAYLDGLAEHYGAGLRLLDFQLAPEPSRAAINEWVEDATEDRIKDLIPQGVISPLTRLVLANAIYFNAKWERPFEKKNTAARPFHLLDGSSASVPTMSQVAGLLYAEGDGWQAGELPYRGGRATLLVIVPAAGRFAELEGKLDGAFIDGVIAGLASRQVELALPSFSFEATLPLKQLLASMGMHLAFDAAQADLSGMDGARDLHVEDALHKAFVRVDEEGTEAAAATAVVVDTRSVNVGEVKLTADRPFIVVLRDRATGAVLFVGRVLDPR